MLKRIFTVLFLLTASTSFAEREYKDYDCNSYKSDVCKKVVVEGYKRLSCDCVLYYAKDQKKCEYSDIVYTLNYGDAIEINRLAADYVAYQKKTTAREIFDPYEAFARAYGLGHFNSDVISLAQGCNLYHYLARRKCFDGDKSVIDKAMVKASKTLLTGGPVDGRKQIEPYAINDVCSFDNPRRIPYTPAFTAVQFLNPNFVEALVELYLEANDAGVSYTSLPDVYRSAATEIPIRFKGKNKNLTVYVKEVAIKNQPMRSYKRVGDVYARKLEEKGEFSYRSGYRRLCIADFYNAEGVYVNKYVGPSRLAYIRKLGTVVDKDNP
ncbi:MAG: hypothetical protein V1647_00445, partial [Pseudomonadota bacterium]